MENILTMKWSNDIIWKIFWPRDGRMISYNICLTMRLGPWVKSDIFVQNSAPWVGNRTFFSQNCVPWIGNRTFFVWTGAPWIGKLVPITAFWHQPNWKILQIHINSLFFSYSRINHEGTAGKFARQCQTGQK